jgi:nucleoside-diphosphate-sugar epimerase
MISESELQELLVGHEILYHLAAVKLHNVENSDLKIIESNVLASNKLFRAAGKAGIKRIIFTSSLYANGNLGPDIAREFDRENPNTLYGTSKLFSEKDLAIASSLYGFSYAIPRLYFIYGPKQFSFGGYKSVIVKNFGRYLSRLPMQIIGTGDQLLDYVYIRDCVEALDAIGSSDFRGVIHISNGVGISIRELVHTMSQICGSSEIENLGPDWTSGTSRVGSNELLISEIGYRPKTTLLEGLQRTWESLSNE